MEIDDLELFLRVLEAGSFAAAARASGLDPSLVSRRVASLEAEVGARLLNRTTRALSPTDAGRDWAERIRPAVRALRDAEDELRTDLSAVRGAVRVAAPGALGRRRIAPIVAGVLRDHPGLRVDLKLSDARLDLAEEGVDIAVRVGAPRDPAFVVRRLGRSPQVFVAAPSIPVPDPLTFEGLPVVLRVEMGATLSALPGGARPGWDVRFTADDVEVVASAIEAGLGVGMLPEWLASDGIARGSLVRWPDLVDVPAPPVVALVPAGRAVPRRVRIVLDAIAASMGPG